MASVAQNVAGLHSGRWEWFRSFLSKELSPYPGRIWIVARMTLAATIMMFWIMTFRIPGAALGAYYTLLFVRDTPQATVKSALTSVTAVCCALIFVLVGAITLTGDPFLHFLWVAGTIFVTFFLISSLSDYRAGTGFGFLAMNAITNWDFPTNTRLRIEDTLWTALAIITAALVTVIIEVVSEPFHPVNHFREGLDDRLACVESVLNSLGTGEDVPETIRQKLSQYGVIGTGTLRRLLLRSNRSQPYITEMSALIALTARLVDLSANVVLLPIKAHPEAKVRLKQAGAYISKLRVAIAQDDLESVSIGEFPPSTQDFPYLANVENTLSLVDQVLVGKQMLSEYLPSRADLEKPKHLFKDGAFTNPAHVRFALRGTLAALTCYVVYNAVAWKGLSNSVSTCMITALSTIGSSRQKQFLRVAGALFGGVVLAMSAQVIILPLLNGIGGFSLLFVAVTFLSSWIATSSPRLSYAGVQTAFAFYVIHLRGFGPDTSLTPARDDVMGILFGLFAMWLLFDTIWSKDAASQMMESFVKNVRTIASFDKQITQGELRLAIGRSRATRDAIGVAFDQIRSESDAVVFEFGAHRAEKLLLRDRVRDWQTRLRAYYLTQAAILHYRLISSNRLLDDESEQKILASEQVLQLFADWNDSAKRSNREQINAQLKTSVDQASNLLAATPVPDPDRITPQLLSRSMLELAASLGKAALAV
jgi:multidrug resistance protein MdtO